MYLPISMYANFDGKRKHIGLGMGRLFTRNSGFRVLEDPQKLNKIFLQFFWAIFDDFSKLTVPRGAAELEKIIKYGKKIEREKTI